MKITISTEDYIHGIENNSDVESKLKIALDLETGSMIHEECMRFVKDTIRILDNRNVTLDNPEIDKKIMENNNNEQQS